MLKIRKTRIASVVFSLWEGMKMGVEIQPAHLFKVPCNNFIVVKKKEKCFFMTNFI